MTKITPTSQTPTHAPPATKVRQTRENWEISNDIKSEVTIQPGQMNNLICSETGNRHEYRHQMKGTYKPKLS